MNIRVWPVCGRVPESLAILKCSSPGMPDTRGACLCVRTRCRLGRSARLLPTLIPWLTADHYWRARAFPGLSTSLACACCSNKVTYLLASRVADTCPRQSQDLTRFVSGGETNLSFLHAGRALGIRIIWVGEANGSCSS